MVDNLHSPVGQRPARGPNGELIVDMATLADVAREAGVSIATASRVLNGSTRKVAEVYRERVLALAGSREVDRAHQSELDQELEAYIGLGGKPVFISQPSTAYPTLDFRNRESARLLAVALVDRGHRSILVLGGPQHLLTSRDRLAGFREGASGRNVEIPDERVVECELSRNGGHDAVLALPEEVLAGIDLVFAISDVIAIGAMTALRARGLEIPVDVSVAGFDDVPGAQDTLPPLTTVRLPLVAAGRTAVRIALGLETPPELPPGEVVLRGSTPARG